jgi:tRNA(Arg) A34 adenosine deaminase TadA
MSNQTGWICRLSKAKRETKMEEEQSGITGITHQSSANQTDCNRELLNRLLDVMENNLVPLTQEGVKEGNKVFGAAILKKSDLSLVIAGTNNETENPLWHGEIHAIKLFWEMPREQRPNPGDCIFFATHEPCTLCLSAITWGGYDNFYYLFSHEDSRDSFHIGHDLRILKEVFKHDPGGYARDNGYWKSYNLRKLIDAHDENTQKDFLARIEKLKKIYAQMSEVYQQNKWNTDIPLK